MIGAGAPLPPRLGHPPADRTIERQAALQLTIRLARQIHLRGRVTAWPKPQPGDLVVEITGFGWTDPDAIGWLAAHGPAPYRRDGHGKKREVWDVWSLHSRVEQRWENANFAVIPPSLYQGLDLTPPDGWHTGWITDPHRRPLA